MPPLAPGAGHAKMRMLRARHRSWCRLVRISTVLGCCHQHAPCFLRRSRHLRRTYQAACSYLCLSGMLAQRPQGMVRITVVTPRKGHYDLQLSEDAVPEDIRRGLVEAKTFAKPYREPMLPKSRDDVEVRFVYRGVPLRPTDTLKKRNLAGEQLLAVPGIKEPRNSLRLAAPRGLLMTSSRAWKPSQARQPREALLIEPELGTYSANLVHPVLKPHPRLPMPT
eukprot:s3429_g7.t2